MKELKIMLKAFGRATIWEQVIALSLAGIATWIGHVILNILVAIFSSKPN